MSLSIGDFTRLRSFSLHLCRVFFRPCYIYVRYAKRTDGTHIRHFKNMPSCFRDVSFLIILAIPRFWLPFFVRFSSKPKLLSYSITFFFVYFVSGLFISFHFGVFLNHFLLLRPPILKEPIRSNIACMVFL